MPDNSKQIFHTNLLDDYYPNRPLELNNECLYDIASWFDFKTEPCHHKDQEKGCCILQNEFGYLHKRNKPKIMKTETIKPSDNESRENYFYQMLFLFKPWSNEKEDLKQNFNSYEEAFINSVQNNTIKNALVTKFQDQQKRIQEAINYANKLIEQAKLENDLNLSNLNSNNDNEYCEKLLKLGVNDLNFNEITHENLTSSIKNLNIEQNEIFNLIINSIAHQQKSKAKCKDCNNINTKVHTSTMHKCTYKSLKPLKLFVSGVAGTGKSYLIDTICKQIQFDNQANPNEWSVAVLAPTGIAAFNINGLTIHRFFKLPVFNDKEEKHWQLTDGALKVIRTYLKNLKLIIIGFLSIKI